MPAQSAYMHHFPSRGGDVDRRIASVREEGASIHWFCLANLGCALLSGALLWLLPSTGPWALAIAFLPWLVQLTHKRISLQLQRTALDIPVAIFLITAVVGVWASYNLQAALTKLWIIVAAILVYYAIASQPPQNFRWVLAMLSAIIAAISIYYLLTLNAGMLSTDLTIIDRLVAGWTALRPRVNAASPHPNIAGGLIALMAPYILALLEEARQNKQRGLMFFTLASGGIAAFGLLMSSSRAAWISLAVGLGFWLLWWLSGRLAGGEHARQRLIFATSAALLLVLGALLLMRYPGGPIALFERLPGPDTTTSRLEIMRGALRLERDFPYTGGGLHAFPGLFSRYILVIPSYFINYAHNLYLDLAVEQGVAGLFAYLLLLAGAAWLLIRELRRGRAQGAVLAGLASLIVLALHGIADDPIYAGRGTPFLLLAPAMAVAISREADALKLFPRGKSARVRLGIAALLVAAGLFTAFRQPLLSSYYANLGAIRMARVELEDFPTNLWDDGRRVDKLVTAEDNFYRALELNPHNATAHYRLGLINLLRRDFPAAQEHLEQSLAADPQQRGARKNLGFVYVWNGEYEQAMRLMRHAGGVRYELEVYTGWWRAQGRPDLAERAEEMLARLP